MQPVNFMDLGRVDYKQTWDLQEALLHELVKEKTDNINLPPDRRFPPRHFLLFCEHPHVYTLGKSGKQDHLLLDEKQLEANEAVFYKINRGGDITYHGPGQIVGYPILNLDHFFHDIHRYLRFLEEAIIRTLAEFNIKGERIEKLTGVWIDAHDPVQARKICAFGVRCSRWVTMHGFALNVNTNLEYFNNIIPCGISDKAVTSIQKELGYDPGMDRVKEILKENLSDVFGMKLIDSPIPAIVQPVPVL